MQLPCKSNAFSNGMDNDAVSLPWVDVTAIKQNHGTSVALIPWILFLLAHIQIKSFC